MDTKQVLIEARELIAAKGWIQNEAQSSGGFCALAAIYHIVEGVGNHQAVRSLYHESSCRLHAIVDSSVITWNDDPCRTKEEVLEAFDKAIALTP